MTHTLLLYILIAVIVVLLCAIWWFWHHQRLLKVRAMLMREAIRNRDFTFRIPTTGSFCGERALQETLNEMGGDIKRLMAKGEVESWQRLTRVLTHEIMNAVAPISSISQAYMNMPQVKGTPLEEGIRAIHDTSNSLSAFVDSFRKMTQLQVATPQPVALLDFVESVKVLYPDVEWKVMIENGSIVNADPNMLRQVVVNIVKNAIEAGARHIAVTAKADESEGDVCRAIRVSNDGKPIAPQVACEIFVPFFTTKSTGSGIGLSLSRQMMVSQGGNLLLAEIPEAGYHTTFVIETNTKA